MLGVCVTVLSIGKLASPGTLHWLFDKLLGLASLAFLASAVLSFVSIRSRTQWGDWKRSRNWSFSQPSCCSAEYHW
jgi:hypothetical protein